MTIPIASRWEHGSEFHWDDFLQNNERTDCPWTGAGTMYGSGRDALKALLLHGAKFLNWDRIFIPSFFCQEVVKEMKCMGLEAVLYSDAPGQAPVWPIDIATGDVVFVINYFGLRCGLDLSQLRDSGVMIIEDHSHDPLSEWAYSSIADYCLCSLRKTLPLPEGGIVWSPRRRVLPEAYAVSDTRQRAVDAKRAGMILKRLYLLGQPVEKEDFRKLLIEGEREIAADEISGMTSTSKVLLEYFPFTRWRSERLKNFWFLAKLLELAPNLCVLKPENAECVPFNVTVVTKTREQCSLLKKRLIERKIFPAVLWSLERPELAGTPKNHSDLSRRMLSLHCDSRYQSDDLSYVAQTIVEIMKETE